MEGLSGCRSLGFRLQRYRQSSFDALKLESKQQAQTRLPVAYEPKGWTISWMDPAPHGEKAWLQQLLMKRTSAGFGFFSLNFLSVSPVHRIQKAWLEL